MMKKKLTLLGMFLCLMLFSGGLFAQEATKNNETNASASPGIESSSGNANLLSCNINAGGNQSFCFTTDSLYLYGSQSGIDLSTIVWTQVSPASPLLTISNPNSLNTSVYAGSYPPGNYVFQISGDCEDDGTNKTDLVTLTITPATSTAIIYDPSGAVVTADPYVVCTELELVGSAPGPGETGYWSSATDPYGHHFTQTDDTIHATMFQSSTGCTDVTYYYTISNGGCISVDTVNVRYDRGSSNVYIYGANPRNVCGDTISFTGSNLGCNSTGSWTIIPPSGVPVPAVVSIWASGRMISYNFVTGGTYQLIYNVISNGTCPGGSDTIDVNVCISSANGIGGNQYIYVCDSFPDTVFLSSIVDPYYNYGNWNLISANAGTPPVNIVQTGVGQAYALIYDQSLENYNFRILASGDTCTFGTTTLNCDRYKTVYVRRALRFNVDADTLNIFCQNPGAFYTPSTYLSSLTSGFGSYTLNSIQVPAGCTSITLGANYSPSSSLDFSCEGTYIFRTTSAINVGNGVICRDTMEWVVNVATLQNPNAGSDSYVDICDLELDTVDLVGNAPIDINGVLNTNALLQWTQVGGPAVTFIGSSAVQIASVTGFTDPGVYMFEYSFSRDVDCYLADTMFVYIDSCTACPTFDLKTCCDLINTSAGSRNGIDPAIQAVIDAHNSNMSNKYSSKDSTGGYDCCDPCNYPTDSFPVFIMDEFNMMVDASQYTITWSHDPGNSGSFAFLFPNQQTIVTVAGPDSCVWQDTLIITCCTDTIEINAFCTWDPCDFPNAPIPLNVQDQDGNILSGPQYTFVWSNAVTGNTTSALLADLPVSVTVTDTNGCIYTDTFTLDCCTPDIPVNLLCTATDGGSFLSWDPVPGAVSYILYLTVDDPDCCRGGLPYSLIPITVTGTSHVIPSTTAGCFSWYVVAVCANGDQSQPSGKECSCTENEPCEIDAPVNLKCEATDGGSFLSWDPVPGAVSYILYLTVDDPDCCRGGLPYSLIPITVTGTSHVIPSTTAGCFSWYVVAVCADGDQSQPSGKECSCTENEPCEIDAPVNLKCEATDGGSFLSWDPVPGAVSYILYLTVDDPDCCRGGLPYSLIPITVTGTSHAIPSTTAGCFSWYVVAVCADGDRSENSDKECSCSDEKPCEVEAPVNLECEETNGGSLLSWDPVPGAASYLVYISVNDPNCCENTGIPYSLLPVSVTGTSYHVPSLTAGCFLWYVVAVCANGDRSDRSDAKCSCSRVNLDCEIKAPVNLECNQSRAGQYLEWDPVVGATSYQVTIYYGDPDCCPRGTPQSVQFPITVTTNNYLFSSLSKCFSWTVVAICADGTKSDASDKKCSCHIDFDELEDAKKGAASTINGLNIEAIHATAVPNPATEVVTISLHSHGEIIELTNAQLVIMDFTGKEVYSSSISMDESKRINVNNFNSGVYVYNIVHEGVVVISNKLVIQ